MPELEPITREEMLLDGEDLTPITRKEKFIKRIYDKTQEIPEPITREEMFLKKAGEGGGGDIDLQTLNVTENGTVNAPSGVAYDKVVTNVPSVLPENAYLKKNMTAGAIASFNDGADMVLPSLVASIVPQQDLHGYDSPWVGGAGKNKFDKNASGIAPDNYLNHNTGEITPSANGWYTSDFIPVNGGETLTISGIGTTRSSEWCSYDENMTFISGVSTTIRTYTTPSNARYIRVDYIGTSQSTVQVEQGETATSYASYENICPITGWTEEVITRTGKNLLNYPNIATQTYRGITVSKGTDGYTFDGTCTGDICFCLTNEYITNYYLSQKLTNVIKMKRGTYTISGALSPSNAEGNLSILYGTNVGGEYNTSGNSWATIKNTSITVTFDSEWYITPLFSIANGKTVSSVVGTIQIELGSTATTYEPYKGTTTTIPFTDGQGQSVTVYGGEIDVINGGEQPNPYNVIDLSTLNWSKSGTDNKFVATLSDAVRFPTYTSATLANIICSNYKTVSAKACYDATNDYAIGGAYYNSTNRLIINDIAKYNSMTAEEFKTAMSGVQLRYELATPTTLYTQPTAVKSIEDENNVWASTGEITEGSYFSKEA